ncbi:MAG: DUF1254 domain-containing protein, partial [Novosphingobium sp.]
AAVATALAEVAAAASDPATAAEGEAYVMRVLTACLNDAFLAHLFTAGGLSRALPVRGGPNPDYRMAHAALDPSRRYRLEGRLNRSERVGVGVYRLGLGGALDPAGYAAFERVSVAADGGFALDIAADAQAPGGLALEADARLLMIRTLHRDPAGEPAHLVLSGGDGTRDLALAGGSVEAALGHAAAALLRSIRTYLEWTEVTRAARNRFHPEAPTLTQGVQGDPDTVYFLGSYDLDDGEWLEVALPAGLTGYWSLHAYDTWCQALPGAGTGDHSARADADGRMRIAVGPSGGGDAANRIDTLGRRRGVLIARFITADAVAVPHTEVRQEPAAA